MDKTKGVMTALKGRTGFGSKKGVNLLGIVQKLTAKREAMKEGGGPSRPALPSQAKVPSKTLPEQAKGKPKGRPFA